MPHARQTDLKALALAVAGLALLMSAPPHRVDLPAYGILAVFAGCAWRPWVGAALIGALLPFHMFSREIAGLSFSPPGAALWLAVAATLARAAWARWRRAPLPFGWPSNGYDAPLLLFLIAGLVSLAVTQYPRLSLRELRALLLEPALFFVLISCLRGGDARRAALGGFLASATLTAAVACVTVLVAQSGTEAEGVRRAQAWYPSPNHLALMLGRAFPWLFAAAIAIPSRGLLWRTLGWVGTAVTAAGMLFTFSLGAWVGSAAAAAATLFALGLRRLAAGLVLSAVLAFALVTALAIGGLLPERLNPLRSSSVFRFELWLSSLAMLRDHLLFGVGLDNFVYLYQQVYLREGAAAEANLNHPHNWILHVWLGLGLLGLGAFLWLLARFARHARSALWVTRDRWLVAGAIGCMADTLVHGLLDNSYFLPDLAFLFWLTLSLVVPRPAEPDSVEHPVPPTVDEGRAGAIGRMTAT